ncbi:MAG: DHH family phosphoesterase [Thermoplasmata archaeon]
MPARELPRSLSSALQKAREVSSSLSSGAEAVRIISHYDADGLCAAGILCRALLKRAVPFHCTIVHSLDAAAIEALRLQDYPVTIFSDIGSGYLELLEGLNKRIIVIDHHGPVRDSKTVAQLNCHLWGVNGAFEASASSLALLFAVSLNETNWELAGLALAGSMGDRQHIGGWRGLNAEILAVAERLGYARTRRSLVMDGDTLVRALAESNEPFIRGVSGNPGGAAALVEAAGLSPAAAPGEIDPAGARALASLIALRLLKQGTPDEFVASVLVDRHYLPGFGTDAAELSAVVNACGRLDREELGLSVCMGSREALTEAREVRRQYRSHVMKRMLELQERGIQEMRHIQYFYAESASMGGALAALVMNFLFPGPKPTVSLSSSGGRVKISLRGTREMTSRGLDLARAAAAAARRCGGQGGGHSIAAGATIPLGMDMNFLEALDTEVGAWLGGRAWGGGESG